MSIDLHKRHTLWIGLSMLGTAGLSMALTPRRQAFPPAPGVSLEQAIPPVIGTWHMAETVTPMHLDPLVQRRLDALYRQTLTRTYANAHGNRIMLSIAYGSDQGSERTQAHNPEYCYEAQGFDVTRIADASLSTPYGALQVRRLVGRLEGRQQLRQEPITYWVTVGDRSLLPGIQRSLAQLAHGLAGNIPDGLVFRVSSVSTDTAGAFQAQEDFIHQLLATVAPSTRAQLIGKPHHD